MMFHFLFFTITISKRKYSEKDVEQALLMQKMEEKREEFYTKYAHYFRHM